MSQEKGNGFMQDDKLRSEPSIVCSSCGTRLNPQDRACPNCGGGDRHITVSEEFKALEMTTLSKRPSGARKYEERVKIGEKISGETRQPAREHLIIDRKGDRKYHHVEEQDKSGQWRTMHHHDGSLIEKKKRP
jgi:predicted RNA-binding Zn-ribbon protein involved in translation (DUF1610 family)